MPAIEHPISMDAERHRAFSDKVFYLTVGIVNLVRVTATTPEGKKMSFEEMGTGSACKWRDKKFILTAKHVLEGAGPQQLRFFLRPTESIEWVARSGPPAFSGYRALPIEKIIQCPHEDLAAIVLKSEGGDDSNLHFRDLPDGLQPVPSGDGVTLLIGYPGDQSFPVAVSHSPSGQVNYQCAATPEALWGSIVEEVPRYLPSSFDSDRHFLIRFDPREEGFMPHGFSGSGVWYQGRSNAAFWAANPVLCGVQTRWHRESNSMFAVRPEAIKRFLEEEIVG